MAADDDGNWTRMYALVLGSLAAVIAACTLVSWWFR
jgi:hypothetical protein